MQKLLADNSRLIWYWVRRYAGLCVDHPELDPEDLYQSGFFGLIDAQRTYEAERGSWITWASYYIRNAMLDALGLRTVNGTYEITNADGETERHRFFVGSLDAPAYDDESDVSLGDTVADDSLPPTDEGLIAADDAQAVRDAVADLQNPMQRDAISKHYLEGQTMAATGEALGFDTARTNQLCRAGIGKLRNDKRIRRIYNERFIDNETPFVRHKGVTAFWNSRSSVVEDAVIRRESLRAKVMP